MHHLSFVICLQLAAYCLFTTNTFAQNGDKVKFGKITPEDFKPTPYEKDTSAHAVVIADIGSTEFLGVKDRLDLLYKRYQRVKILDANGYEAAAVKINIYTGGDVDEELSHVRATAYNLENGKVVETKLDSKNIFTEKEEDHKIKKFVVPAVKEGTIIEYSYEINSPYPVYLRPWYFQGEYPHLFTEYTVTIPEVFSYAFLMQDINHLISRKVTEGRENFTLTFEEHATAAPIYGSFSAATAKYVWTGRNIPVLKEEKYTTSLLNFATRIEFQLSSINYPGQKPRPVRTTWDEFADELNKSDYFGAPLYKDNSFLRNTVDQLVQGHKSDTAKARRIYDYVRTHFTCTDHEGLTLTNTLKTIFTSQSGNVADINLLLVAMLRQAKLEANPVILSTRGHGYTDEKYPLKRRFNYTMAALKVDSTNYFMDASLPYLGFGKVDMLCYNGHARIIALEAIPVYFSSDKLVEQKSTHVVATIADGSVKGTIQQYPTYFESCIIRSDIGKDGVDKYFAAKAKDFTGEATTGGGELENLYDNEQALKLKYDFDLKTDNAGMLYINPLFGEAWLKNPLHAQERYYPVEMPAVLDESYSLNLKIPEGYELEELPKSTVIKYNNTEGLFQYLYQQNDDGVQFRSRIKLNRATFSPDEYKSLREFFDLIVKKQSEQIVLKKKG